MRKTTLMLLALCTVLAFGCTTRLPLNSRVENEYGLTSTDLAGLGYSLSETVRFRNVTNRIERTVSNGKLILKKKTFVKRLVVRRRKVLPPQNISTDKIVLSLEDGDTLAFTRKPAGSTSGIRPDDSYWLVADGKDEGGYYYLLKGSKYYGPEPYSVRLEVRLKAYSDVKYETEKLGGGK